MSKNNKNSGFESETEKRTAFLVNSAVWVLIIILTLLQDYYGARWKGGFYDFYESLVYKLFWVLFIPSYLIFRDLYKRLLGGTNKEDPRTRRIITLTALPLVMGLIHLFLFAFLLFGVSSLLDSEPWNLSWLIKEKLTSRFYIVIAVYFVYYLLEFRRSRGNLLADRKYQDRLTFKVGSKLFVVDTSSIRWIQADAGYLEIHTPGKVHVVVDSLKHMLTLLDPEQFRRIHKSTIVNLRLIDSFRSRHNGDYDVLLKDGSNIRLSRNYAKPFKGTLL
jgi:hypothetical protein